MPNRRKAARDAAAYAAIEQCCQCCRFYTRPQQCHRHSPILGFVTDTNHMTATRWPQVMPDDWCGDWEWSARICDLKSEM